MKPYLPKNLRKQRQTIHSRKLLPQDTKDTDSLFSDADLEGFITEFTDDGFRVSVVTKPTTRDSGLIEVSSGEEEASVVCQQNTLYQRLEMDHSTETRNSLKNISQSDLSRTIICLYSAVSRTVYGRRKSDCRCMEIMIPHILFMYKTPGSGLQGAFL